MKEMPPVSSRASQIVAATSRIIVAILLGLFVLAVGAMVLTLLKVSPESSLTTPWLGPFCMHTTMLVMSVLLMLALSKGKILSFGFRWIRASNLKSVAMLSFGIGTVGALILALLPSQETATFEEFTFLQIVIFIWFYASICEEILTRGLIQGYLAPFMGHCIGMFKLRLSLPVIVGALFFSLMHIMPLGASLGISKLLFFLLFAAILGVIAGYYREKTGSLVPAVIVHMMFNISGSLVDFLVESSR
jgi:membrane protease YdiL (CAAX protease family)